MMVEYLTRALEKVTLQTFLKFHHICNCLKLANLGFDDDLMILCKNYTPTIKITPAAFGYFSVTSITKGLHYCKHLKCEKPKLQLNKSYSISKS